MVNFIILVEKLHCSAQNALITCKLEICISCIRMHNLYTVRITIPVRLMLDDIMSSFFSSFFLVCTFLFRIHEINVIYT